MHCKRLASKTFLNKVKNLLLKIGSEYKIYQPKAMVFMHYYILFFDVVDFSALRVKCFKSVCEFAY